MKLGTAITIHSNIIAFLAGTGFIMIIKDNVIAGSLLLLASGIYGNIFARYVANRIKGIIFPFLAPYPPKNK